VEALELMALQYLSDDNGNLDHEYMSAGEHCLDCLEQLEYVKGDGRIYRFTTISEYYKESKRNHHDGIEEFLSGFNRNKGKNNEKTKTDGVLHTSRNGGGRAKG
jgi:hypothetical protein